MISPNERRTNTIYEKILALLKNRVSLEITMSFGQLFTASGYEKETTERIKSPVIVMYVSDNEYPLFVNTDFIESFSMIFDDR